MTPPRPTPHAVLFAPRGVKGPVRGLVDRLNGAGVKTASVEEIGALMTACNRTEHETNPPVVLCDLTELDTTELDDTKLASDALRRVVVALPRIQPIAITDGASAAILLACVRAGAADLIDLRLEGTGNARTIVSRVWQRQAERASAAANTRALRGMIEDLVRDLVRTERRSIDLEERAAEARQPAILLIEAERKIADDLADRLEASGVVTYAYATGEEALLHAARLAERSGLDLALVAAQLPGIDGLETVRRLRAAIPKLDAFLMTNVDSIDLATDAADLGVVGYVHKPLEDIDDVVARLGQLAREALQHTREHRYVERIKARHERVLERYRALPREP